MAMNREQKRMLQRQGQLDADGEQIIQQRAARAPLQSKPEDKTSPGQFLREVRSELHKVAWPSRAELIMYSIVVFITLAVLTAYVAGVDWVFGELVLRLFGAR